MQELFGELAVLAHRTQEAEKRILARAQERDGEVQARLDHLRPLALADDAAAQEYSRLVLERATLARVMSQAQAHLS